MQKRGKNKKPNYTPCSFLLGQSQALGKNREDLRQNNVSWYEYTQKQGGINVLKVMHKFVPKA